MDESAAPPHEFNIHPVPAEKGYTLQEACLRCHTDRDLTWVDATIKTLKYQL